MEKFRETDFLSLNFETVSSNEYLDVVFSNSETFISATNSAYSIKNLSVKATVSLIIRLNLKAWDPVNTLFSSLVASYSMQFQFEA